MISNLIGSLICTFTSNSCSVTFAASSFALSSANKYVVRLTESTTFHTVSVRAQLAITSSAGVLRYQHVDNQVFVTPQGATNPGFKFYVGTAGTWTTTFQLSSTPAPTVSQYSFTLWSVTGNALSSYAT